MTSNPATPASGEPAPAAASAAAPPPSTEPPAAAAPPTAGSTSAGPAVAAGALGAAGAPGAPAGPPAPAPASPAAPAAGPAAPAAGPTAPAPANPTAPAPANSAASRSRSTSTSRPSRVLGAIAHLAVLGIAGSVIFTILFTFLGLGLGLLPVLGIGLLFLIALVYLLYALGWFETARIEGLYDFGLRSKLPVRSPKSGFGGFLHTLWLQFIDGEMWRGIANFALATILGLVMLPLLSLGISGVLFAFAPLYATTRTVGIGDTLIEFPLAWAVPAGILLAILGLGAVVALGLLHGVIARAVMVPSREAQLAQQAREANLQRAGAVRSAEVERTRIERDLHDGVQPRLVSVGMTLGLAQQKVDADPAAAKELIAEAHTSTKAAITELRQLARGIHTSVLDDRGLDAALSALAGRSHIPVALDVRLTQRCSRDAEAAVYFVIAEALTNAAKHSRASECRVIVREREGGMLWARVEDNGLGGARAVPGGGLDGIANRVLGVGGTFRLDSPAGGPTSVEVSVPCAF